MSIVLIAEHISKRFKIQHNRPVSLKESIVQHLTGCRAKDMSFWALRDVSFSLEQGRSLGIIGHNGAGKSTLLRLLCGLGRPNTGRIQYKGYVNGLLELGTGLHLDMTGRENILTEGLLSGLTKRQILEQREEIIAFAELEEFIDQQVRTYSTGMYLRLAFSTAIHFDPDILIIDEVLAVGDSRFQQKCLDKLKAFQKAGKTLVLVSHDTEQIRRLCDEVLVLEEGQVATQGDPENAIRCYNDLMRKRTERRAAQLSGGVGQPSQVKEDGGRFGTREATVSSVRLYNTRGEETDSIQSGDSLAVVLEYRLAKPLPDMALTLGIYNEGNVKCFETAILSTNAKFGALTEEGTLKCFLAELPLLAGRYFIVVGLYPTNWDYVYDYHWQMHVLDIMNECEKTSKISGVISMNPIWSVLT